MIRRPLPPEALDATDRAILNALQDDFPICPDPFGAAAGGLGLDRDGLIARLANLRDIGAITRFGPFYDAEAMGGAFCLCAMEVPEARFDKVAEIVNAMPEVAHNYARDHRLNMWFVLACETPGEIRHTAERLERATGIAVLRFPKLREFFIRFRVAA
jgi:siroheme decarboxylase